MKKEFFTTQLMAGIAAAVIGALLVDYIRANRQGEA